MINHPKWLIDEKVKICCHWVCLRPRILPTLALNTPINNFSKNWIEGIKAKRKRGPIFCQINNRRISLGCNEETSLGSQKWKGTIPNFIIKAITKNTTIKGEEKENKEIKIITEPILWIKKYFAAENEDCALEMIIGRKEKVLNSSLNHIMITLEEEINIIGLINKVEYTIVIIMKFIKERRFYSSYYS